MARLRAIVCGVSVATLVLACNALTGVGDLEAVDDAGGGGTSSGRDGALETSTGTSSSSGGPTIMDSGTDAGGDAADASPDVDSGPTCGAGRTCVPVKPAGWFGPFQVYTGPKDKVPDCPADLPSNDDFATGAPINSGFTCECKCGGVNGASCTAFLEEFDGTVCADAAGEEDLSSCRTPGGTASSVTVNVKVAGAGSCPASAGFKTKEDPDFPSAVRFCHREQDFTGEGCGQNQLCVPDGVAPFRTHTCIFNADATAACPAPWTVRVDAFDDVQDTRACGNGTCSCSPSGNLACSGTMRNYTASQACSGVSDAIPIPFTACYAVGGNSSQRVIPSSLKVTGSCGVNGAPAASGAVAGDPGGIGCCIP